MSNLSLISLWVSLCRLSRSKEEFVGRRCLDAQRLRSASRERKSEEKESKKEDLNEGRITGVRRSFSLLFPSVYKKEKRRTYFPSSCVLSTKSPNPLADVVRDLHNANRKRDWRGVYTPEKNIAGGRGKRKTFSCERDEIASSYRCMKTYTERERQKEDAEKKRERRVEREISTYENKVRVYVQMKKTNSKTPSPVKWKRRRTWREKNPMASFFLSFHLFLFLSSSLNKDDCNDKEATKGSQQQ